MFGKGQILLPQPVKTSIVNFQCDDRKLGYLGYYCYCAIFDAAIPID